MKNWENLRSQIINSIKPNDNQEITGEELQYTLTSMVNSLGDNRTFVDVAKPITNPGTPDGPVFYFAFETGYYPNFSNVYVKTTSILINNSTGWEVIEFDMSTFLPKHGSAVDKSLYDISLYKQNAFLLNGDAVTNSNYNIYKIKGKILKQNFIAHLYSKGAEIPLFCAFDENDKYLGDLVYIDYVFNGELYVKVDNSKFNTIAYILTNVLKLSSNNIDYVNGNYEPKFYNEYLLSYSQNLQQNITMDNNSNYISEPYLTNINSFVTVDGAIQTIDSQYNVFRVDCCGVKGKINAHVVLTGADIPIVIAFDSNDNVISKILIDKSKSQHDVSFEISSNVSYVLFNVYGNVTFNLINSLLSVSLEADNILLNNAMVALTKQVVNGNAVKFSTKPYNYIFNNGKIEFSSAFYSNKYELVEISNFDNSVDFSFKAYFNGSGLPAALILDNNYNIIQTIGLASTNGFTTIKCEANTGAAYILVNTVGGINGINSIDKIPGKKADITTNFSKKEISILFIGNSLTQDAISCLPLILKEVCPDVSFRLICYYNAGRTLKQQYDDFLLTNKNCEIFSVSENSISWENRNNIVDINSILNNYDFDIVCLQEYSYFNFSESEIRINYENIVSFITSRYNKPLKFITLLDSPNRSKVETMYTNAVSIVKTIMKDTICEDVLVPGAVIYEALDSQLKSLGDSGNLSPDGTHAQEGLPCLMQAYVIALWIFKQLGIPKSIFGFKKYITPDLYNIINVPGPNLGSGVITGTVSQNMLAQQIAIDVFKKYNKEL